MSTNTKFTFSIRKSVHFLRKIKSSCRCCLLLV